MKALRLTLLGKVIVFLFIVAVVGGVLYYFGGFDSFLPGKVNLGGAGGGKPAPALQAGAARQRETRNRPSSGRCFERRGG